MPRRYVNLTALLVVSLSSPAWAQEIEVPILVMEAPETEMAETDADLDLANIVQSAAKAVTTVQEAPAIITILTASELQERGVRNLTETLDLVPGWNRFGAFYHSIPQVSTRGAAQSMLFLRDGISMFDPIYNATTVSRMVPLETVKRFEVVTGPGGVLWGANSYLGVVNLITKDAEDVEGIEASAGYGDGPGDAGVFRAYAMAGVPRLLSDSAKLFVHASYETWAGAAFEKPYFMLDAPMPQPTAPFLYGPMATADPQRSYFVNFDGKLTLGGLKISWSVPFGQQWNGLGISGRVVQENFPEYSDPACSPLPLDDPEVGSTTDHCIDRGRQGNIGGNQWYDRVGVAEYRAQIADGAQLTTKGYFIQFKRTFNPFLVYPPIENLLEGGVAWIAAPTSYRSGGAFDGTAELGRHLRLLYGAEGFHEWLDVTTVESRQGPGSQGGFVAPYDLGRLNLPCPHTASWNDTTGTFDPDSIGYVNGCPLTYIFETNRTVLGAYLAGQVRPTRRLILDAGVRAQMAPDALSIRPYDPQYLGSASVVYQFIDNWYLKLNWAQGFRPPVFNNTDSNGEAISLKGMRNLVPETSDAYQSEINARLLRGTRHVRELTVRADYSYTRLHDVIHFDRGLYENFGDQGIHSAEVLAKLYLKGGHRVELGYTWLKMAMTDKGWYRASPEHWFNVGAVFAFIPNRLDASSTLRVWGAFEDMNRRTDVSDLAWPTGDDPYLTMGDSNETKSVYANEVVADRIPAAAELEASLRLRLMKDRLLLAATAQNMLNSRHYQTDPNYGFSPRVELLPIPYEDFRAFASLTYKY